MLLEPSRPYLHGEPARRNRRSLTAADLRLAAAGAAALLLITSTGDLLLLVILLGAAGGSVRTGVAAALVGWAWAVRWGTTSLTAISGAQAVLGPAGLVGPASGTASAWCGAGALLLAGSPSWSAPAFGLAAAFGVAAPSLSGPGAVAVRAIAAVVGVGVAAGFARLVPPDRARPAALALAAGAVALAVVS